MQIPPRDLQRREQSEYDRGPCRDHDRVRDRAPIDFPVNVVGHLVRRDGRCDQARAHDGQKNSKRNTEQPEHEAFGQKLADDSGATGAERRPDGYLAPAPRRPRQQEVRHVRAGNEQHERDARHHEHEDERHFPRQKRVTQRAQPGDPAFIRARILRSEAPGDRIELLARLRHRDAWLQPAKCEEPAEVPLILRDQRHERDPQPLIVRKREPLRHDPHHRVGLAVHKDGLPDDVLASAIPMHPDVVAQQDDVRRAFAVVHRGEVAATNRVRTEHRKQIPRHTGTEVPLRFAMTVRDRQASAADGRDAREHRVRFVPVAHVEVRQAGFIVRFLFLLADHQNAIRVGVGIGLEQHAVDKAENGGVQADTEAEAEYRDSREPLAAREVAQSVADILE